MPRDKQCPSLGRLSPDVLTYHHEAAVISLGEANRWNLLNFSIRGSSDELLGLIKLLKCIASYYTSRLHLNGLSNQRKNMFLPIWNQLKTMTDLLTWEVVFKTKKDLSWLTKSTKTAICRACRRCSCYFVNPAVGWRLQDLNVGHHHFLSMAEPWLE